MILSNNGYLLMNKDNIVATFQKIEGTFEDISYKLTSFNKDMLPIGFTDITTWIDGRKASKHNKHLKEIMERLGCANSEGFIKLTHATSINDTFWVKNEKENVAWKDVSLYVNEFTESISALALAGIGLYNEEFSPTGLPEFVSDGSFPKCFKKEKTEIWIYKGGTHGASRAGLEPYCEVLASEISNHLSQDSVVYNLARIHGKLASKCKLFSNEQYGYVPFKKIAEQGKVVTLDTAFQYFCNIGSEETFRQMLLTDAFTFNTDRHTGNYGALFNNDTLEIIRMAPIFDLNLSMLPYLSEQDFDCIGDNLLKYGPVLGSDFTRLGQQALTEKNRDAVKDLCDWQFSFAGNSEFTRKRIKSLEEIVSRQARAVLSNDKLQTRNVFVPETADEVKLAAKDKKEDSDYFASEIETLGLPVLVSLDADSRRAVVIVEPVNPNEGDYLFEFDFLQNEARVYFNFSEIEVGALVGDYPEVYKIFSLINEKFENILRERHTSQRE